MMQVDARRHQPEPEEHEDHIHAHQEAREAGVDLVLRYHVIDAGEGGPGRRGLFALESIPVLCGEGDELNF